MVTAQVVHGPIDPVGLYGEFLRGEGVSSGTVVVHHGRVKRPGKVVASFSSVVLEPICPDPVARLHELCGEARERFGLHRVLLVHRVGVLGAAEAVLVVVVSAPDRDAAFDGCRFLVDQVKREDAIRLRELPSPGTGSTEGRIEKR